MRILQSACVNGATARELCATRNSCLLLPPMTGPVTCQARSETYLADTDYLKSLSEASISRRSDPSRGRIGEWSSLALPTSAWFATCFSTSPAAGEHWQQSIWKTY